MLALRADLVGKAASASLMGLGKKFEETEFFGNRDFSGGRRGGGAHVGDPVRNGKVGFMTYGGDDGDAGFVDRFGDNFFIKSPKIFDAAAAAPDDENVSEIVFIEIVNSLGDFLGGPFSLHFNGIEDDVKAGKSASQDIENVLNDGSGGTRDDTDAAGQFGKWFFVRGIKPAARLEVFFELMEFEQKLSHPEKLQLADDELVLATGGVEADFSCGDHLVAFFWQAGEASGVAFKKNSGNLSIGVFEGKIEVA